MVTLKAGGLEKVLSQGSDFIDGASELSVWLDESVRSVFRQLVSSFGRQQSMAITGMTIHQLKGSCEHVNGGYYTRRVAADAFYRACSALGFEPQDVALVPRRRRPTNAEIKDEYVALTPKIRGMVRQFIVGKTVDKAAAELGISSDQLKDYYVASSMTRYIPKVLLERIQDAPLSGAEHQHYRLSMAWYRRIGAAERETISLFRMGGSLEEAIALVELFGFGGAALLSIREPGANFVDEHMFNFLSAIVDIRKAAGYYAFVDKDARTLERRVGNLRLTAGRRKVLDDYAHSFHPPNLYVQAAAALGVDAVLLKRSMRGNANFVPVWLYLRVLEKSGADTLSKEDADLKAYVGRSKLLESVSLNLSTAALRELFGPSDSYNGSKSALGDGFRASSERCILEALRIMASPDFKQYLANPKKCILEVVNILANPDLRLEGFVEEIKRYASILRGNSHIIGCLGGNYTVPYKDFAYYVRGAAQSFRAEKGL